MAGIQDVYALVEKGKAKLIAAAVQEALDAGCDPTEILNEGMIKAMDAVGEKFKNGEIAFVSKSFTQGDNGITGKKVEFSIPTALNPDNVRAQNVQPLRAQLNQPISVHLKEPIALNSTT